MNADLAPAVHHYLHVALTIGMIGAYAIVGLALLTLIVRIAWIGAR